MTPAKRCAPTIAVLYLATLKGQGKEADFTERKTFLRSFIKRIEVNKKQAIVHYNLPIPQSMPSREQVGVLPIETLGGPWGTVPELLFEKKELIPRLQQLLISCSRAATQC